MYKGLDSNGNSIKIPVSAEDLYLNRGEELHECIPFTYHSIIDVIPIKSKPGDFNFNYEHNTNDEDDSDEDDNDTHSVDNDININKDEDIDDSKGTKSFVSIPKSFPKSGRKESKFYRFKESFVLYRNHKQVIRSKFHVPILAHSPCPRLPKFKLGSENKAKNIRKMTKIENDVA